MKSNVTKERVFKAGEYGWKALFQMALLHTALQMGSGLIIVLLQKRLGGIWNRTGLFTGLVTIALQPLWFGIVYGALLAWNGREIGFADCLHYVKRRETWLQIFLLGLVQALVHRAVWGALWLVNWGAGGRVALGLRGLFSLLSWWVTIRLALAPYLMIGQQKPALRAAWESFRRMRGYVLPYIWLPVPILWWRWLLGIFAIVAAEGVTGAARDYAGKAGAEISILSGSILAHVLLLLLTPYVRLMYAGFCTRWMPGDWAGRQKTVQEGAAG